MFIHTYITTSYYLESSDFDHEWEIDYKIHELDHAFPTPVEPMQASTYIL